MMVCVYESNQGLVEFIDKHPQLHSAKCQPRDIQIVSGPNTAKMRELIAIDIRRGQGLDPIGVAKGLLHD